MYSFKLKLVCGAASVVLFKEVEVWEEWYLGAPIENASVETQKAAKATTEEVENFIFWKVN